MDIQAELVKYEDGVGIDFYEHIIKSLRDFLGNIDQIEKSKGGMIIFYKKKSAEDDELIMQAFPFKKNLPLFDCKKVCEETRLKILKKINEVKEYHEYWHCIHFKSYNKSKGHLTKVVPREDILQYDQFEKACWDKFGEEVFAGEIPKNKYEQVLVESGCDSVCLIPIPVLSTPSIILALDNVNLSNLEETLTAIYYYSRESITKYVIIRLLNSLKDFIKRKGGQIEKRELLKEFIDQLCHVLLPISYQINNDPEIPYYTKWPKDGIDSSLELDLLNGEFKVRFKLTSFCYVNIDPSDRNRKAYKLLHEMDVYKSNIAQSIELLQLTFSLLYDYWEVVRNVESKVMDELMRSLSGVTTSLSNKITDLIKEDIGGFLTHANNKLGNNEPINGLKVQFDGDEGTVSLRLRNVPIFDYENMQGKTKKGANNILSGFIYLQEIIRHFTKEKNPQPLRAEDLYDYVLTPKSIIAEKTGLPIKHDNAYTDTDDAVVDKYSTDMPIKTIKEILDMEAEESINSLIYYLKQLNDEKVRAIKGKETFKMLMMYYKGYLQLRGKGVKFKEWDYNQYIIPLKEKIDKWKNDDPSHFDKIFQETPSIFNDEKGLPHSVVQSSSAKKQERVKDCIKAVLKEIQNRGKKASFKDGVDKLLANFEESGLAGASDGNNNWVNYKYMQNPSNSYYIDWDKNYFS